MSRPQPTPIGPRCGAGPLRLRRLGIDTYQEPVVYLRSDSPICKAEGFEARSRLELWRDGRCIIATLNVVHFALVGAEEIGLSEAAWRALGGDDGDRVLVAHAPPLQSFAAVRSKIYGRPFGADAAGAIVTDIAAGRYSDIELVASILSKKAAAGSTHVLIDVPVGRTAKVRSAEEAGALAQRLTEVGRGLGIQVSVQMTDGAQPVGRGIGPALEAYDVLSVLQNEPDAPADLRQRALMLAGGVLELAGKAAPGAGMAMAAGMLASGAAWEKFQAICAAQGGMRTPPRAAYTRTVPAAHAGRVVAIDNRVLARVAKLAGAPKAPAAGLVFHAPLGAVLRVGQPLLTLHAESPGELAYALAYASAQDNLVTLREES